MGTMPNRADLPFPSWRSDEGWTAYQQGWTMGARHARTGDPLDHSDARCLPLIAESDEAAKEYPFGPINGAFRAGYDAGYESALTPEQTAAIFGPTRSEA